MKYNNLYEIDERKQLIASELIILRTAKGYTQKEVAEKINVKLGTYNAYEKARSEPPAEVLVRLSYLYDVTIDEIVQKENLLKDPEEVKKMIDEYTKAFEELGTGIDNGDVDLKEATSQMLELNNQITKVFYEVNKVMTDTTDEEK